MTIAAPSRQELHQAARRLAPVLRDRAEDDPGARRVPRANIDDLRAAGLLGVLQARRNGGLEADLATHLDVVGAVAEGCPSTGWVLGVAHAHSWLIGHFPQAAQDEIYGPDGGGPDQLVAAVVGPRGTAVRAEGGFRLTGRWPFGSGVERSDRWVLLGARVVEPPGPGNGSGPDGTGGEPARVDEGQLALPIEDVGLIDDWHVTGLRATGSCTIEVDDVFVPRHRFLSMPALVGGRSPGRDLHDGWLPGAAPVPVLALCLTGSAVGAARAALDAFRELLPGRRLPYTGRLQIESPVLHAQVADAALRIDEGELLLRRTAQAIDDTGRAGREMELADRVRCRVDCATGVRRCLEAVEILFKAGGGAGIRSDSRLGRLQADLQAMNQHALLNLETNQELYGRLLVGLEPDSPLA